MVDEPERLVRIGSTVDVPGMGTFHALHFGHVTYALLRDRVQSFESVAAYSYSPSSPSTAGSGEDAEQVLAARATWDLFPLLGVEAHKGRFFGPEEDRPGAARVVVIGHGWWQRRFGSDPDVLGETVRIEGHPHRILGVAPRASPFRSWKDRSGPGSTAPVENRPFGRRRRGLFGNVPSGFPASRARPAWSVYTLCMATKTISLRLEAYETLRRARRRPGESFSDVVLRATWPAETLTAGELLERSRRSGPFFSAESLDRIERLKAEDRPPEDKWQRT